jgi:hypothetical protein
MTNVIDLDEPHLKREGMIQSRIRVGKASKPSRPQARTVRRKRLHYNVIGVHKDFGARVTADVCKHLDRGTSFPDSKGSHR